MEGLYRNAITKLYVLVYVYMYVCMYSRYFILGTLDKMFYLKVFRNLLRYIYIRTRYLRLYMFFNIRRKNE